MKNTVLVTTILKNGNAYKFSLPHKEFISTIHRDNNKRMAEWIEADDNLPYKTFYEIIGLKFNKETWKIETIELRATLLTIGSNK